MALKKLVPHGRFRDPRADLQDNGRIINPPMYAQMGGAKAIGRKLKRNRLVVSHGTR